MIGVRLGACCQIEGRVFPQSVRHSPIRMSEENTERERSTGLYSFSESGIHRIRSLHLGATFNILQSSMQEMIGYLSDL